ncbi:MAG: hypothetical protein L6Q98_18240 [Anaerolineae bacterium]|nr:hypothetical protein [Anaerolineae bacterium]NUQ06424.1 hypothetical protein [Anaerolineae bacterium]
MSSSTRRLPYTAADGKTYKRDYTTDRGLYLIAQYLRVKHDRPVLDEIRRFLAAAGAFVDIYRGLWGRPAAALRKELSISSNANLRDHQPTLALYYQGIVEEVCAQKLGEREEVWWEEARDIIRRVAAIIGRQAQETSALLERDIATGKSLLPIQHSS